MSSVETTSRKGTLSVRKLRELKLRSGLPFMINARELATDECYLEYPDGSIKLISVAHTSSNMDVIRELTSKEASQLRRRFNFSSIIL